VLKDITEQLAIVKVLAVLQGDVLNERHDCFGLLIAEEILDDLHVVHRNAPHT